eukprot:TRINITY_DN11261_c0_g1_i5.p1 TRINITY_DN11261_c0_g1~~TRINITY_DN11261_c0_g1_i5.p1  ORF type:complete len:267 (+),score=77.27 TRINITY_DN11261_c0_g1_i5:100-801(+)
MGMNDFQKGMQKSMAEAQKIPHFHFADDYDVTAIMQFRDELKQSHQRPPTLTAFLLKSFSNALLEFPILNSLYDPQREFEFTEYASHNITIAVDSPNGLVVPNIKNVQNLSIAEIQAELDRLKKAAEVGRISLKDLTGGTICISNIGSLGTTVTSPVIFPPQICIVGIGKMHVLPRYAVVNGKVDETRLLPRRIITISFGCDHRVLDGATVVRFGNRWKTLLENPAQMVINLR